MALAEVPAIATVVAPVVTPDVLALASALQRDAIVVEIATADVLRGAAAARVYVFCAGASLAVALAGRIVEWSANRAGLIGVLPDGGTEEREALLAAGFDDVIAGSLSIRELSSRVRAVHRRIHRTAGDGRRRWGAYTLDVAQHTLWTQGESIALTSTEVAVMRALMAAAGRPLSRAELLDAVWGGAELDVTERAVDNVILRLRRKLPSPDELETVRGVGFRLADQSARR